MRLIERIINRFHRLTHQMVLGFMVTLHCRWSSLKNNWRNFTKRNRVDNRINLTIKNRNGENRSASNNEDWWTNTSLKRDTSKNKRINILYIISYNKNIIKKFFLKTIDFYIFFFTHIKQLSRCLEKKINLAWIRIDNECIYDRSSWMKYEISNYICSDCLNYIIYIIFYSSDIFFPIFSSRPKINSNYIFYEYKFNYNYNMLIKMIYILKNDVNKNVNKNDKEFVK